MTPKEKAEQLLNRFYFDTTLNELEASKECALIAVDVILNDVGAKDWSGDIACEGRNYWQEVKKEIEKL